MGEKIRFGTTMTLEIQRIRSSLTKIVNDRNERDALALCRALENVLGAITDSSRQSKPKISIVIPVYNEEENIAQLFSSIVEVMSKLSHTYEIIFVDDGSSDKSISVLEGLSKDLSYVTVIQLARNFGQQIALSAGLEYSTGEGVICMDADMQDSPDAIAALIEKWQEGYQVVFGQRINRKETFFKRFAYLVFYRLLRLIADIKMPLDAGDFCIMDREVVDHIVSMPERTRFLRGIRSWIGFKQIGIPIERKARDSGRPKYTINRLISLALDGLISFSVKPLRFISFFGLSVSACSVLLAIFYTFKKITVGLAPPGFATIVVFISFFAGVQLITIGVIGEYVGRIFEETKKRPLYIVKKVFSRKSPE